MALAQLAGSKQSNLLFQDVPNYFVPFAMEMEGTDPCKAEGASDGDRWRLRDLNPQSNKTCTEKMDSDSFTFGFHYSATSLTSATLHLLYCRDATFWKESSLAQQNQL